MKNIIVAVAITAVVSVALTLVVVTIVHGRATSSGISSVESCRDALVEIDVICQSMPRSDAEQRVDRLLATPNFYRCGDPRWHDYEPSYVSCFANHERAKQIRTELDAWWSAHQDIAPAEARLVHQDPAAANMSTPGSAVAGSDRHAAVADANAAPNADATVDVFTNISENGYRADARQLLATGTGYAAYVENQRDDDGNVTSHLLQCKARKCTVTPFADGQGGLLADVSISGALTGHTLRAEARMETLTTGKEQWSFNDDATKVTIVVEPMEPDANGRLTARPPITSSATLIDCNAHKTCVDLVVR